LIIIQNIKRLQFNILDHVLVPEHRVLNNEEVDQIKLKYNIKDDSQFPDISRFDPVAQIIGIRPGEKLHEQMIGSNDANSTYEYLKYFKILPQINRWEKDKLRIKNGKKVPEGFIYSSDKNSEWMTKSNFQKWFDTNKKYIGKI
jgi:DNA-directed RNA polymerase subunit H (RpoH/RPB5)